MTFLHGSETPVTTTPISNYEKLIYMDIIKERYKTWSEEERKEAKEVEGEMIELGMIDKWISITIEHPGKSTKKKGEILRMTLDKEEETQLQKQMEKEKEEEMRRKLKEEIREEIREKMDEWIEEMVKEEIERIQEIKRLQRMNRARMIRCYNCGRYGHYRSVCWFGNNQNNSRGYEENRNNANRNDLHKKNFYESTLEKQEEEMEFRSKEQKQEMNEREEDDEQREIRRIAERYPNLIKTMKEIERIEHTEYTEATIKTKGDEIINVGISRVPMALRQETQELLDLYLRVGVIRESTSQWRNRTFIKEETTPDGDRKLRLITDMSLLNNITETMKYEIPLAKEMIWEMQGARWFTSIDLKDEYFQIKLREEDRHKTAFRIMGKTYEYCSMPIGYKNSPMILQKMMEEILRDLMKTKKIAVYMDIIMVYTKTREEHMKLVMRVLDTLEQYNLRINIKKMRVARNSIRVLGMATDGIEREPLEMKKNEALSFPKPEKVKDMRSFLGKMTQYSEYIPRFEILEMPLRRLIRDKEENQALEWNETAEIVYKLIKQRLREARKLALPDNSKGYILTTDASDYGIGAVLEQEGPKGRVPIEWKGRGLTSVERNYGTIDKELLAIVWATDKFEYHLRGKRFRLITDHKPLLEIKNSADFAKGRRRIIRAMEYLNEFDFSIEYQPGLILIEPDVLSMIYRDRLEGEIEKKKKSNTSEKREQALIRKHTIEQNGKQYWLMEYGEKREIPEEHLRKEILRRAHEATVHKGVRRIVEEVKKNYYWRQLYEQAEEITKQCEICVRNNRKTARESRFIETARRLELVGLDIMREEKEGVDILVMIDYFTRVAKIGIIPNRTTREVKKDIDSFIVEYGTPETIISGNAKELTSEEMRRFMVERGIRHEKVGIEAHTSNGKVERLIRTIRERLEKLDVKRPLKERLAEIEIIYNNTWHSAIKMTPIKAWEDEEEATQANREDGTYANTFKYKEREQFYEGEQVLIARYNNLGINQKRSQRGRFYN
ncbi:hypothetical protein NECID01_1248 [Nematocida sp. AWRm77]|nr:hypothetical protein NECID01_1248 [Nematocida sp. AWRm77]